MEYAVIAVAGLLCYPSADALAQGVTDAQIASIVVTANQVDIDAGKMAEARATNDEVKTFAFAAALGLMLGIAGLSMRTSPKPRHTPSHSAPSRRCARRLST